ncbi:MAG: hypothetical protein ACI8ZF_000407 [Candidatus Midichloriaceae bacterium]|jgi:hypothetical protein
MNKDKSGWYDKFTLESMIYLVKIILKDAEYNGINDDRNFCITYDINYEGVQTPKFLKDKYPDRIMVVIQHKFKNLKVFEDYFEIELSFGLQYHRIVVPFKAIIFFSDPSQNFELEFDNPKVDFLYSNNFNFFDEYTNLESKNEDVKSLPENVISLENFKNSKDS